MLLRGTPTSAPGRDAAWFLIGTGALDIVHSVAILAIYAGSPPTPYAGIALPVGVATLSVGLGARRQSPRAMGRLLAGLWLAWMAQIGFGAYYALLHPPAGTDIASLTPSPMVRA